MKVIEQAYKDFFCIHCKSITLQDVRQQAMVHLERNNLTIQPHKNHFKIEHACGGASAAQDPDPRKETAGITQE